MKSSLFIGAGLALTAAVAFAAKDPVVMTVNGRDVHRSEFEYLYHKNTKQQIEPQPLDQYVEMFKVYKLKVADALANGVDTTKTFKRDMNQYRSELAGPLLVDSVLLYKLAHEQYDRGATEREVHHIMLFKTPDKAKNRELRQRMDSLHTVLANGGDFEELARQFSQDQGSKANGGNMGFVMAGMLPVEFEEVMYSLPEGQISDVTETQMGYHILKGGASRPFSGFCEASHILFSTQGKDEAGSTHWPTAWLTCSARTRASSRLWQKNTPTTPRWHRMAAPCLPSAPARWSKSSPTPLSRLPTVRFQIP